MPRIPDFLIVGAQKGGTTAAARNLNLHPDVSVFSGTTEYGQKELEFFNQHWERGVSWYSQHFEAGPRVIGEKTAEVLHRTVCHRRMCEVNPQFKLVVLLRSPVDRAYSQWKMAALVKRDERDSFDAVVSRELAMLNDEMYREWFYGCMETERSCWREGYLLKGFYAEQIESLYRWFPKKNIYVGVSERVRADLASGYRGILDFLEVDFRQAAFVEHFLGRPALPMSHWARETLSRVYREPTQRLFSLLGTEIPEWRQ